ncbi:MAG: class II aldolase/adducin family protein, partial [Candidatus Accumulibacter sp.]|nr:class II aldolase/adducin family protein [Accumulibacter sp.]
MPDLRLKLIATARGMTASGLNRGTAGNLSVRVDDGRDGFLITPTGMDYEALQADDVVFMRLDGTPQGRRKPSSEWR